MDKERSIKLHLSTQIGGNRDTFMILRLVGLFFLIQSFFLTASATVFPDQTDCESGEIWTVYAVPENNLWTSVTYGNGVFVAVAQSGSNRVMRSTDGVNWTAHLAVEANPWTAVTYGNGKFVAVAAGGENKVMISSDGISWAPHKGIDDQTSWTSITYGGDKFVAVGINGSNRVMTSLDGINWNAYEGYSKSWSSVTYGNGNYVAIAGFGSDGGAMTSIDGITWEEHSTPEISWNSVTYGDGKFVAVGNETVMTSVTGVDWETNSAPSANWQSVTYGNGKFLAIASTGQNQVMSSMDGISWTAIEAAEENQWRSVIYGNDRFVAVANSHLMTSECTPSTSVPSKPINLNASVAYGEVSISFTLESDGGSPIINYEYSLDGVNWTAFNPVFVSSPVIITGLDNGREYGISIRAVNAIGISEASQEITVTIPAPDFPSAPSNLSTAVTDGSVYISFVLEDDGGSPILNYEYNLDGGGWTAFDPVFISSPVVIRGLENGREYSISLRAVNAVGEGPASQAVTAIPAACDAGENWSAYSTAFTGPWQSITYGNGRFVALAQDGQVKSSEDGEIWSISRGADNSFWRSVTFGNGKFVAVSFFRRIIHSTDGINWTVQEAAESRDWNSVAFGNGRFVAVAGRDSNPLDPYKSKQVMSSTDGINWTAHEAAELNDWISVTFGNGIFVAVARDGVNRVMTSSDGITWTAHQTSEDSSWGSIAFGDGRFVSVSFNKVMTSSDGVTWTGTSIDGLWGSITHGNGKFVSIAGSGTNRVMSSTDGVNWTIHQAAEDSGWSSVTYGQGKFVAIARFSDRVMISECSPPLTIPDTPTQLNAAVADRLVDISFVQEDDGGSSILGFEYSLDGGEWINFESSPLMISGLENDREYSISLRAVNAIGVSEASEVITFTPTEDCPVGQFWTTHPASEPSGWFGITYGGGKYVAVSRFGSNRIMSSTDGINWTSYRAPEINSWNSVTYGNGKFVAVSRDGVNRVMSSKDGTNWNEHPVLQNEWNSVTYGNGRFVAVARSGTNRIMSSVDGETWDAIQAPEEIQLNGVTYANGKFVAVGGTGTNRVMVSTDGVNWTGHKAAIESDWYSVSYGSGRFVAVAFGGNKQVMSSTDGITWTAHEVPEANPWISVTYGLGRFVAVAQTGSTRVMSSTDGINWTGYKASESNGWFAVTYGKGQFVAVSTSGTNQVMVSDCSIPSAELKAPTNLVAMPVDGEIEIAFTAPYDGVSPITNYEYTLDEGANWIPFDPEQTVSPLTITGLSNNTEYSLALRAVNTAGPGAASITVKAIPEPCFDGQQWTVHQAAEANVWRSVAYGNGKFVAVAQNGTNQVMSSTDGINWTASTAPAAQWSSVTFGNGKFLAVASFGTNQVMSSEDGINWTAHEAAEANNWQSVTFGDGKFVAIAATGTNRVMSSTDGISWTSHSDIGGLNMWGSVTYGNGSFVAVGFNSVMSSTDGINWTAHTPAEANSWSSVTYGNEKFVAVALNGSNQVMSSVDGINWTAHQAAAASGWRSVTFGKDRFVAVTSNSVMSSLDGVKWTSHRAKDTSTWGSVVYGGGKFVAVAGFGANLVMISECEPIFETTVPSAPINPNAIEGDTEIEVSFTPGDDGGSPIINYEYSLDGGETWISFDPEISTSPVTITGLTNGTEYTIMLRAINAIGAGASSESITAIPINDPSIIFEPIDVSLALDESGKTILQPQHIINSGTTELPDGTLSFDKNQFDCTDIGENTVKVTITDPQGEVAEAEVKVTVYDDMAPVIKTKTEIHVKLDGDGVGVLTVDDIDDGSTDNCSIVEWALSKVEFDPNDAGEATVIYTVKDSSGNQASKEIKVTVDVVLSSGPVEVNMVNPVKLYPNPTKNLINIAYAHKIDDHLKVIEVIDVNGRIMHQITEFDRNGDTITIDVGKYRAGAYMVRLVSHRNVQLLRFNLTK